MIRRRQQGRHIRDPDGEVRCTFKTKVVKVEWQHGPGACDRCGRMRRVGWVLEEVWRAGQARRARARERAQRRQQQASLVARRRRAAWVKGR